MKFFKFEAEGDTVYVSADDEHAARGFFTEHIGPVPAAMLTVTEIQESDIPEGEYVL